MVLTCRDFAWRYMWSSQLGKCFGIWRVEDRDAANPVRMPRTQDDLPGNVSGAEDEKPGVGPYKSQEACVHTDARTED